MYFNGLKKKWGIISNFQLVIIFIVFGITGTLSAKFAEPILNFIGINEQFFKSIFLGEYIYWIMRILIIFPIYQILLLFFGALFFQFSFFWNFEKKILKKIGLKRFFKDN